MFERRDIERRSRARSDEKELLENESIFLSVEDMIRWKQAVSDIRLRGILVCSTVIFIAAELYLVYQHSKGAITLPQDVITAIAVHMGGSGLGLTLTYIVKNLFPRSR